MFRAWVWGCVSLVSLGVANAADIECSQCEAWNREQAPFRIFGNTYFVGPHGLSSVLITSPNGHILIDGALPQSARLIAQHVEALGFKMSDVKIILNSHAHYDHAGGIAKLQQLSGAKVIASDLSAGVLRSGKADSGDPQLNTLMPFPAVANVEALGVRSSVELGGLRLDVIHTPGHTRGGTSWRWQSCEDKRCLNIVFADSMNSVSDDAFKYGGDPRYPNAASDVSKSIAAIAAAPCDIVVTVHSDSSGLWSAFDEHGKGDRMRLIDSDACKQYAATAKQTLQKRLEQERR